MVGPSEVDDELETEVKEEAETHGKVTKVLIHVVAPKKEVRIFLLYDSKESAQKAKTSLDRRWFGGRIIEARYYDEARFAGKDYES